MGARSGVGSGGEILSSLIPLAQEMISDTPIIPVIMVTINFVASLSVPCRKKNPRNMFKVRCR